MRPLNIQRIAAESFVQRVAYQEEVGSTNDWALQLAVRQDAVFPLLVATERQLAGRGRGANQWWSAAGALTFSTVVDATQQHLPPAAWPRLSLTVGLAVSEAVEQLLPRHAVRLKWPNDVYLEGRKVCGILIEGVPQRPGVLVVGVGLNVNNSFRNAPAPLSSTGVSLAEVADRDFDRTDVLLAVLNRLARHLDGFGFADSESLAEAWRRRCYLEGRTVTLEMGPNRVTGVCQGIADDGALLLQSDTGVHRYYAGTVARIL